MIRVINSIPSVSANTVAPYAPLGRQAVGLESTDLKRSSFKALEQTAASGRNENQRSPSGQSQETSGQLFVGSKPQPAAQTQDQQASPEDRKRERATKEKEQIAQLAARDREVRAHERAHAAVAGQYAGGTTYVFVKGPDGVNYAVGGEVSINTAAVPNDPEATIRKAQQVRQAANAPAEPSAQDRRVAAEAASLELDARAEVNAERNAAIQEEQKQTDLKNEARKEEDKQRAAEEENLRADVRRENEKRQAVLERSIAERSAILSRSAQTTFDISRRLVAIGAIKGTPSVGNLLNSKV